MYAVERTTKCAAEILHLPERKDNVPLVPLFCVLFQIWENKYKMCGVAGAEIAKPIVVLIRLFGKLFE